MFEALAEDGLIELGIQDLGHQLAISSSLPGSKIKSLLAVPAFFSTLGMGGIFLRRRLGGSILKLAIDDVYGIKFPVFEGFNGCLAAACTPSSSVEEDVLISS